MLNTVLKRIITTSTGSISRMASEDASGNGYGIGDGFYVIVDIGANLTNKKFARDLDSVISRAKEAGKSNPKKRGKNRKIYFKKKVQKKFQKNVKTLSSMR
jgi:hypothetical protein